MSHASSTHEPTFTVVVPAFDAERTVGATVRSILMQTRGDFEVVVVDDGSTDATAMRVEALAADPRLRLLRQPNGGVAAARNTGIAAARGLYVSFLDSDDVWLPTYLEAMGRLLDARPDAGFAYTDAWVWDEHVGRFGRRTMMFTGDPPATVPDDPRRLFRLLLRGNFVYTSATVRRDALAAIGGFDGRVSPAEDWELWLRLAARGRLAVRSEEVLCVHRVRSGSLSSSRAVMQEAAHRLFGVLLTEYGLDEELADLVRERVMDTPRTSDGSTRVDPKRRTLPGPRALTGIRNYRWRPPPHVPHAVRALLDVYHGNS